jgi:hypothetical protein
MKGAGNQPAVIRQEKRIAFSSYGQDLCRQGKRLEFFRMLPVNIGIRLPHGVRWSIELMLLFIFIAKLP